MEETARHHWAKRVILAVHLVFPEHATWPRCERLVPHALLAARYIQTDQIINEEAGRLLFETAPYLQARARYTEAEPLYQRALHIREQVLGYKHPDVASALNNLALLYYQQGKYVEVEPLFQRTLHIREQQLGPDHPLMAYSLNGLANLYGEQGRYTEAEPLYQRALVLREQGLGEIHPETAETLPDLAAFQERQGNRQEALALYQRTLTIREQVLGPEHPKTNETRLRLTALSQSLHQEVPAPLQEDIQAE